MVCGYYGSITFSLQNYHLCSYLNYLFVLETLPTLYTLQDKIFIKKSTITSPQCTFLSFLWTIHIEYLLKNMKCLLLFNFSRYLIL